MAKRILVTPRSITRDGHPALQRLKTAGYELVFSTPGQQPTEEELQRLLPDCVGYLCGVEKVSAGVLSAAGQLRVISRNGTGVDNIDLDAASQRRIRICRAEGANARGVAELTLSLMLALVRGVAFSDRRMKEGAWERRGGFELEGRTLGLVGCGRVGRLVAQFALAFDMQVLAYDPLANPSVRPPGRFEFVPLDALWAKADIVSFHCPPTSDGKPLLDADTVPRLKRGVYLVNTARSALLDTQAVLAALNSGQVAGLATDVFDEEPPRDLRLVQHPSVIATPHLGGFTQESISRAVEVAVDNLLSELNNAAGGTDH